MSILINLPELGENIPAGDVVRVAVAVGDVIAEGDLVLEVETDKAVIEVPAERGGKVVEVLAAAGNKIKVGEPIISLEADAAAGEESTADATPEPTPPAPAPAKSSPFSGSGQESADSPTPSPLSSASLAPVSPKSGLPAPASPSVRREARELGVEINRVPGTGPRGRILVTDVRAFVRRRNQEGAANLASGSVPTAPPLPDFSRWGEIAIDKMSNVRRATARHMATCWSVVPHVTAYDKADITRLEAWRKGFKPGGDEAKPTLTAILLKIVASAMKRFPQFNASVDMAQEQIILKRYVHIGVAVDTAGGLLVPVIRDVDRKNVARLAADLMEVSQKARDRKLGPDDMAGGCFTISNLGGIGGVGFNPIVNYPEVAILGIARGRMEPVYIEGGFQPRLVLPLSLSYDHRLIDGADGARFLDWIRRALEDPMLVLMEG